jgi:hypothetical protein
MTTIVPILPDSPQLAMCVTLFGWPDVKSNCRLAQFGPLFAQDLECFSGMPFDPRRKRVHLFQRFETLCCVSPVRGDQGPLTTYRF